MSRIGFRKLAIAAAAIAASTVAVQAYDVEEIGSFYIGGKPITLSGLAPQDVKSPGEAPQKVDINGDYHTGQMYAQFVKLAHPAAKYPLLMWHTGGITGASWETKPDGNPGWQQFFLKQGHSVYVSDAVERGRASFSRPEIYKSDPTFRDKRDGWEIFRIGAPGSYRTNPADRKAFPGVKFDLSSYDTLQMEAVARWPNTGDATQAAYNELVEKACPCVIMAHGQAGHFAMYAALANPGKVKGLIAIEPAFAPAPDNPAIARLKTVPHLFVWGDFLDANPTWVMHLKGIRPYYDALAANGVPATWMDLPTEGLRGNTHMIMMDTNSDVIAARVQSWMSRSGLMHSAAVAGAPALPAAPAAHYAKTPAKKLAKVVNARAHRSNLGASSLIPGAGQQTRSSN